MRETRTDSSSQAGPTPAVPPAVALLWLATVTPGLHAAALLDAGGRAIAGDPSLAGAAAAADLAVARGRALTLVARVTGAPLRRLLEADLATALAAAEAGRTA